MAATVAACMRGAVQMSAGSSCRCGSGGVAVTCVSMTGVASVARVTAIGVTMTNVSEAQAK